MHLNASQRPGQPPGARLAPPRRARLEQCGPGLQRRVWREDERPYGVLSHRMSCGDVGSAGRISAPRFVLERREAQERMKTAERQKDKQSDKSHVFIICLFVLLRGLLTSAPVSSPSSSFSSS